MNFEYQMLTLMTTLFLFAWIPTSVGKYKSFGGQWLASNRKPLPGKILLPWAARAENAYSNLKDFFPAYVVAILLLGQLGKFDEVTKYASLLYIVGRVGHYFFYVWGIVPLRFATFVLAMISNVALLVKIFI